MATFLDIEQARQSIQEAMSHYQTQQAPGWFTDWLDDLYIRLGEDWRTITLDELSTLQELREEGCWLAQAYAMNRAYKMFGRIGRDTTGIIGY
jgi:hypothetical protein